MITTTMCSMGGTASASARPAGAAASRAARARAAAGRARAARGEAGRIGIAFMASPEGEVSVAEDYPVRGGAASSAWPASRPPRPPSEVEDHPTAAGPGREIELERVVRNRLDLAQEDLRRAVARH